MSLIERISEDLKAALKSGAALKVGTLRMVLASVHNREIEKRTKSKETITEEEVLDILRKEVKKRKEAIEIYGGAGRSDLKDKEVDELEVLVSYLPPELDEAEVEKVVKSVISSGVREFGKVMKEVMKQLAGRAEARRVGELVKKNLTG